MKSTRIVLSSLLTLLICHTLNAASGAFFNVTASGTPATLSITLCLNGNGPLTCQNYTVSASSLNITTTIPNHIYSAAGIKVNTPGAGLINCPTLSNGYCLFSVGQTSPANIAINPNEPWFPSLEAFEHYNSGRSHVFPNASFGGNYGGSNVVNTIDSTWDAYPSGYNMSYLDANDVYIYGGGYGDIATSIGAFVAKVDPDTLAYIWHDQLIDVKDPSSPNYGEWDYPGSMGIMNDGYLYVSYGYRLAKIDPTTGEVISTLILPTGEALPENTSFNGFNATSDGMIIMKSVYRQAGCAYQGPSALLDCPDPSDVPPSILISVNPQTMQVVDNITLPAPVGARPTIGIYNGQNYVYLLEPTTAIRYAVNNGQFVLDSSWNPGTIVLSGQTLATSFVVMNNWVVAQTNTLPASTALDVIAINQGNASEQYSLQPFAGDSIPDYILAAFHTAGPDGTQAISWAPMSLSADSENNLIYASDALPGEIAALTISNNGLQTVWKVSQRTTEFTALIGPQNERVLVGTDIPSPEIPGNNSHDYAVWRNAATGAEIAESPELNAMTQGTMIQPDYAGDMFYEGQVGTLYKLLPSSAS